jgi:hypothetical protein
MMLMILLTRFGIKEVAGSGGKKKRRQKVYEYTPCTTVNIGKKEIYIYRRLFFTT